MGTKHYTSGRVKSSRYPGRYLDTYVNEAGHVFQAGTFPFAEPVIADIPDSPDCGDDPVFDDFDFMVLRYKWEVGSGQDLDTFTGFKDTGSGYDGDPTSQTNWVGYAQNGGNRIIPIGSSTPYLNWGADNTGSSGIEAILIDLKKFVADFPSTPNPVKVRMNAVWFTSKGTGDIIIELTTYKGGTMTLDAPNYNFVNTGGTLVTQVDLHKNIVNQSGSALITNSQDVAILEYNPTTKIATLNLV